MADDVYYATATPESVCATFQETDRQLKESEIQLQKSHVEFDQRMKKSNATFDSRIKNWEKPWEHGRTLSS